MPWGRLQAPAGRAVLRSDAFRRLEDEPPGIDDTVSGTVTDVRFRGDRFELTVRTDPGDLALVIKDRHPAARGDAVVYAVDTLAVVAVGPEA